MNQRESLWAGPFGVAYTARNRVPWAKRLPFWRSILLYTDQQQPAAQVRSVLEVGCNAGWNLMALRALRRPDPPLSLMGIEINPDAAEEARAEGFLIYTGAANLLLPLLPSVADLVFTAGVLIHVGPDELAETMRNIVAASRRYVLAIEYAAPQETDVEYRGSRGRLWKRPYGKLYADMGLRMLDSDNVSQVDGFDDCAWWLLEKPQ